MFTVHITRKAQKQFEKLSPKIRDRVLEAFIHLRTNPFSGKKLEGEHDGYWAIRIWPYRVIYTINKGTITVTVVSIGDRKDVYEKLRREDPQAIAKALDK